MSTCLISCKLKVNIRFGILRVHTWQASTAQRYDDDPGTRISYLQNELQRTLFSLSFPFLSFFAKNFQTTY